MARSRRTAYRNCCKNLQRSRNREIRITRFGISVTSMRDKSGRYVMKELVEVIAKSLVENPDEVVVTET